MRYLILSDVHSNKEALGAVLPFTSAASPGTRSCSWATSSATAPTQPAVDLMRPLKPFVGIRGNHDKVCSGIEDGELFNRIASRRACGRAAS
jgi:hypothetical protein